MVALLVSNRTCSTISTLLEETMTIWRAPIGHPWFATGPGWSGHESSESGMPSPSRSEGASGTYAARTLVDSAGTGGQVSPSEKTCTGRGAGRTNGRSEGVLSVQNQGGQTPPQGKRAGRAP